MTQLVITIKDDKIIPYLKKVLEAISGVVNVKTCSEKTETIVDPDTGWALNDDIVSDVVAYRSKDIWLKMQMIYLPNWMHELHYSLLFKLQESI